MYRFLWRPAWIVSHVLILALIVAMVSLGLWQLRRLDESRTGTAQIEAELRRGPLTMDEAVALSTRTVTRPRDTGRSRPSVPTTPPARSRSGGGSFEGAPGRWVATPMVPSDGVDDGAGRARLDPRGASTTPTCPIDGVEPPTGEVEVPGT